MPKIVTLMPSATEIVSALGFDAHIVGRSHECDYPAAVQDRPVLTESKFDPEGDSAQINERVLTVLQEALSVYRVHADTLRELQPDIIVTQEQCEVCAVSFDEVQRVACDYLDTDAHIVSLRPNALEDVFADFQRVADALGVPERGKQLVGRTKARMGSVSAKATTLADKPTVALIEWINPLMAAGNWMPTLVEMAGGVNLFGEAGAHSPWMTYESLQTADPDVIVLLPCGFDIARTRQELPTLTSKRDWHDLTAVQNGRVYLTDGNQYFNRPGPRLAESVEILAEIFHPGVFDFGHNGTGWENLTLQI